jgi:ABC-type transport system involved in multi-copper enzyme maturation permease subunit
MRTELWAEDFKSLLLSRRAGYSIVIMAALALLIAIIVSLAPEGLRNALSAAAQGSSSVFEYLWIEDVVDKLLLLIFVSFGSYAICDIEDDRTVELSYSRPQTRSGMIMRRLACSLAAFLFIFVAGSMIAAVIGSLIVGELDASIFILHQVMLLPMCLFVISLTFLLSVPMRTTAPTVITSFGISLALSFTYTFLLMGGDTDPSVLNPLALGYRILVGLPLEYASGIALVMSILMLGGGFLWFTKKDL